MSFSISPSEKVTVPVAGVTSTPTDSKPVAGGTESFLVSSQRTVTTPNVPPFRTTVNIAEVGPESGGEDKGDEKDKGEVKAVVLYSRAQELILSFFTPVIFLIAHIIIYAIVT